MKTFSHAGVLSLCLVAACATFGLSGTAMANTVSPVHAPADPADLDGGTLFDDADRTVEEDYQNLLVDVGLVNSAVGDYITCMPPMLPSVCSDDLTRYEDAFAQYNADLAALNAAEAADEASDAPPTSVPEPATLALFGLGLAGIALSRRKLAR